MPRPPKADQDRKSNMLRIRMTPDERAALDAAALHEGLETSTWARTTLLRSARRKGGAVAVPWITAAAPRGSEPTRTE